MSERTHIIQALIAFLLLAATAFVFPDAEPVNALPAVHVKSDGCNSCHVPLIKE